MLHGNNRSRRKWIIRYYLKKCSELHLTLRKDTRDNLTTASLRIRSDQRAFSELRSAFPNGCWLYTAQTPQLDAIYLPFSFSSGVSEFLEERMFALCSRAVESLNESSQELSAGLILYAYPFEVDGNHRFSIATYVDVARSSMPCDLGRASAKAARIADKLKTLVRNSNEPAVDL